MYKIANPADKAMQGMGNAAGTYGSMMKDIPANRKQGPTAGGALMAGMGGAAMGATIAGTEAGAAGLTAIGLTGWGIPIAAALGIGAYLLS